MRIGWLRDQVPCAGGAEMNADALKVAAPKEVEIVDCPEGKVSAEVDRYVLHNCVTYPAAIIETIKDKPVFKMCHDVWPHGDPKLREWVYAHARGVILVSPKLREWIPQTITAPVAFVPSIIDHAVFERAGKSATERRGNVYLGLFHVNKGLIQAAEWAAHQRQYIEAYGWGDMSQIVAPILYRGKAEYADIPRILAKYQRLVFLPQFPDACPRVILEAWFAGCEIVTNAMQGATWWIDNDPGALPYARETFWETVLA